MIHGLVKGIMDIVQIWTTHNRPWTEREVLCFLAILLFCSVILIRAVRSRKMKKKQAAASLLLVIYLGIVFGSTVFTRTTTVRQYKIFPFWSWAEVIMNQNKGLLIDNLLNFVLFIPMGILLPFIMGRKVRTSIAFLSGALVSLAIEICQLVFMRGLFEWDDMIHNGLGCVIGCMIGNVMFRWISSSAKNNS